VNIRVAVDSDARPIAEMHVRTWQVAYRGQVPDDYLDSLSVDQREIGWRQILADDDLSAGGVLVLEDEGGIVGFAAVSASRDDDAGPGIGEVGSIYVLPDFWNRGGGRDLMARAVDTLRAAGFSAATLWVLDTNLRARRFYEAAGWVADGTTKVDDRGTFALREVRYRTTISPDDQADRRPGVDPR
jgi:GNAT superfamily N-acetyltransferase